MLEKGSTIIAWLGVWECSVEERIDVRQIQDVCGVFCCGKCEGADFLAQHSLVLSCGQSEGADFLAQHTLLQVFHPVSSMLEKGTTIKAWQGVWKCSVEERIDVRQIQMCVVCSVVIKVKVQFF